ncbi:MAG: glutathione S-transferase N-terminal domain-containing protein, partial [Alphaproteobacteria bacterium]|nr:glutathione S-transferase N-terminal domain-containing protein [Alphaproteobacteria bacterium]
MTLNLLIGNKNYSSWSMRPWLVLKQFALPFEETVVPLYVDGFKDRLMEWSPVGMVPVLRDGEITVWESLSIMEYLAEKFPDQALWPKEAAARALARSISSEM